MLVYIDEPTFTGCLIDVRPIGVPRMLDLGEPDDKILAVAVDDPLVRDYHDISDLAKHYLREVAPFFGIYKDLEGKRAEIIGWESAAAARKVIEESIVRYADAYLAHGP